MKKSKRADRKSKKGRSKADNIKEEASNDSEACAVDTETIDSPKILTEKKLAPLFVRRSKPNPAVLEARRTFLQSGIPENVRKTLTSELKSACNDSASSSMPFPVVSHVSQTREDEEPEGRGQEDFCRLKPSRKFDFSVDSTRYKSLSNFDDEISKTETEKLVKIERDKFEAVLTEIESRCSDARAMWESICSASRNRSVKKSPKKRNKKLKLQGKIEPPINDENPTWTFKYKPASSAQVVGNDAATNKLRNWLSGWRLPSPKDDQSSGDEFYSSDGSSSGYENNQVAVLLGPHGSGKSASVYAVAEELGYRFVIRRLNCSSILKLTKI